MDEKKMFDKAKKPITRGYADHKITTLQEGFAATNNLADLEEIKVPENCNVCDDGSTPITDDLFELAHHDTSEAESIGYSNFCPIRRTPIRYIMMKTALLCVTLHRMKNSGSVPIASGRTFGAVFGRVPVPACS